MRIMLGFLGFGVIVAALFAIVLTVNSNFDLRSQASRGKNNVRKTCFPWGTRPIKCDSEYDCFVNENTHASPNRNKWGVCVKKTTSPKLVPTNMWCNTSINPPVTCPAGYMCQYGTEKISGSSGTCVKIVTPTKKPPLVRPSIPPNCRYVTRTKDCMQTADSDVTCPTTTFLVCDRKSSNFPDTGLTE